MGSTEKIENNIKLIRILFYFTDELKSLISLIRLLAYSGKVLGNDYTASFVCNKLLKLMLAMSMFSYVGSNFNKNCLFAIAHIMNCIDELRIEKKFISYLSSLCGHVDFEIRMFSWAILLKIASTLNGAKTLVEGMLRVLV